MLVWLHLSFSFSVLPVRLPRFCTPVNKRSERERKGKEHAAVAIWAVNLSTVVMISMYQSVQCSHISFSWESLEISLLHSFDDDVIDHLFYFSVSIRTRNKTKQKVRISKEQQYHPSGQDKTERRIRSVLKRNMCRDSTMIISSIFRANIRVERTTTTTRHIEYEIWFLPVVIEKDIIKDRRARKMLSSNKNFARWRYKTYWHFLHRNVFTRFYLGNSDWFFLLKWHLKKFRKKIEMKWSHVLLFLDRHLVRIRWTTHVFDALIACNNSFSRFAVLLVPSIRSDGNCHTC